MMLINLAGYKCVRFISTLLTKPQLTSFPLLILFFAVFFTEPDTLFAQKNFDFLNAPSTMRHTKSGTPIVEPSLPPPAVVPTPIGEMRGLKLARQATSQSSSVVPLHASGDSFSDPFALTEEPMVYVVVAPRQYARTLLPLLSWKRQMGFLVEEIFFDSACADCLKSRLQRRYDFATPTVPAPLFILLVGDHEQLPQFPARHNIPSLTPHHTDLYYAEFTDDYFPDAILGRFSVGDTSQLEAIIAKTILYEKGMLLDSAILHRSLLVAGRGIIPPAPAATNGQVNYVSELLSVADTCHDVRCFYNPSSADSLRAIEHVLHDGVAMVSYTAHCNAAGWRSPYLTSAVIDTTAFPATPFLSVNNCCRVNEIVGDCFGEHLLRTVPGGAIGVIGASNETLWEEDYYWSVGFSNGVSLHPTWSTSGLGAFDRLLHAHGEARPLHAPTQGQMVAAGNWAVTASGSRYDAFYWEVYSLLGDPALMPYIGTVRGASHEPPHIVAGDTATTITATPYARIALTHGDTLLAVGTADSTGRAQLEAWRPLCDTLLLTLSGQGLVPAQTVVAPLHAEHPRVVVSAIGLTSLDGAPRTFLAAGDTAKLLVALRNVGNVMSAGSQMHLALSSAHAFLSDTLLTVDTLAAGEWSTCTVTLTANEESQMLLYTAVSDDTSLWHFSFPIDVRAPHPSFAAVELLDNGIPANEAVHDSSYVLRVKLYNAGFVDANDLRLTLLETDSTTPIASLPEHDSTTVCFPLLSPHDADTLRLSLLLVGNADTLSTSLAVPCRSRQPLAIQTAPGSRDIAIVPNPTGDSFFIDGLEHKAMMEIFDMRGRIQMRQPVASAQKIDVGHLPQGVYVVKMSPMGQENPLILRLIVTR